MCSDRYAPLLAAAISVVGCSEEQSSPAGALADSGVSTGGGNTGSGGNGPSTGGARSSGGGANASGGMGQASGGRASGAGGANGGTSGAGGANGGTSGAGGSSGGSAGTPPTAEIRVVGRTDGDASPRFEWPGVSIQARFQGTSATLDIDGGDNNFFEVIVDGQVRQKISTGSGRTNVDVVSGLPDAPHDLVIWRRTEALNFA